MFVKKKRKNETAVSEIPPAENDFPLEDTIGTPLRDEDVATSESGTENNQNINPQNQEDYEDKPDERESDSDRESVDENPESAEVPDVGAEPVEQNLPEEIADGEDEPGDADGNAGADNDGESDGDSVPDRNGELKQEKEEPLASEALEKAYCLGAGINPDTLASAKEKLAEIATAVNSKVFDPELIQTAIKILNHDALLKQAREEGLAEGRNEKLEEFRNRKRRMAEEAAAIPHLHGTKKPESPLGTNTIFDIARRAL